MTVPESFIRFRQTYKLTKSATAKAAGIKPASYTYEDKGGAAPNATVITNLAKAFNVSTDYLLGLTDDPRPVNELLDALQGKTDSEDLTAEYATKAELDELKTRLDKMQSTITELKRLTVNQICPLKPL